MDAYEHAHSLNCKIGQGLYLLDEALFVSLKLEFHVDLAVVDGILLLQIVLIYHSYCLLVLL